MMDLLKIQSRSVEEALEVRLSQPWRRAAVRFDEENLVSCAGLVPVMQLAEDTGLHDLVADAVQIDNPPIPSTGAEPGRQDQLDLAGMAAGADSIDDLDLLRHGGMGELFGGIYAPSTLGSFLRAFTCRLGAADSSRRSPSWPSQTSLSTPGAGP